MSEAYVPPGWDEALRPSPYGQVTQPWDVNRPQPAVTHRRGDRVFGVVIALLVAVIVAAAVPTVASAISDSRQVRQVASAYLGDLRSGNLEAAYGHWCAAARAQYPQALYRAQHEHRIGDTFQVHGASVPPWHRSAAEVSYTGADGPGDIMLKKNRAGTWEVCPTGQRLADDMANCGCMTDGQLMESYLARLEALRDPQWTFVSITCPPLTALVDGVPVDCTGVDTAGRRYRITGTESQHATYTTVAVQPLTGDPSAA